MTRVAVDRQRYVEALGDLRRADLLLVGHRNLYDIKDPINTAIKILEDMLEEGIILNE